MDISWIEHILGILAMVACFVILLGFIGLALTWLKACEDSYNRREADKWRQEHSWVRGLSLMEAGEHITKWQPIVIGDDGKAYEARGCGHK